MKKSVYIVFALIVGMLIIVECRHPIPPIPEAVVTPPYNDSICFSDRLFPFLVKNCAQAGCHDNIAHKSNINLSSYSHIISSISGKLLLQVIQDPASHQTSGFSTFTPAQVAMVQKWVDEGMKNGVNCQPCDSVNITFSGTINPIIQKECISCHFDTGTLLANYADVKVTVDNGKFLCTVEQDTCQAMPQDGVKLSDCNINQIKAWIAAGAPNN